MDVIFRAKFDDAVHEEVIAIDEADVIVCYGDKDELHLKMYIDNEYTNWLLGLEAGWAFK